jgi:hypothetical protein
LRRELRSAERFRDTAIFFALVSLNTPRLRSSASLCFVTRCDQRFGDDLRAPVLGRDAGFRAAFRVADFRRSVIRQLRA